MWFVTEKNNLPAGTLYWNSYDDDTGGHATAHFHCSKFNNENKKWNVDDLSIVEPWTGYYVLLHTDMNKQATTEKQVVKQYKNGSLAKADDALIAAMEDVITARVSFLLDEQLQVERNLLKASIFRDVNAVIIINRWIRWVVSVQPQDDTELRYSLLELK